MPTTGPVHYSICILLLLSVHRSQLAVQYTGAVAKYILLLLTVTD